MVPFYQIMNELNRVTKVVEDEKNPERLIKIKIIKDTLDWMVQGEGLIDIEKLILTEVPKIIKEKDDNI